MICSSYLENTLLFCQKQRKHWVANIQLGKSIDWTKRYSWSNSTLITSSVGGAGADPPTRKMDTLAHLKIAPKSLSKTTISHFKVGKQLSIGQFWPKILFFSWVPWFELYIDDKNLKLADSGCCGPYGHGQPELACFRPNGQFRFCS